MTTHHDREQPPAGPAGRLCGSAIASGTLADCARRLVEEVRR